MVDGSIDFTCLGFYVERDIICICLVQICDQILIRIINSDIQIAHMDRDRFFTFLCDLHGLLYAQKLIKVIRDRSASRRIDGDPHG